MRKKLTINRTDLEKIINELENKYSYNTRTELAVAVASTDWAQNYKPKPIPAHLVIARIKEFNLTVKTPIGKRGRSKGITIVRGNKPRKVNEQANKELLASMPNETTLIKRVIAGSKAAAIKAMCKSCTCNQRVEITNCTVLSCPLYNFRPYQK